VSGTLYGVTFTGGNTAVDATLQFGAGGTPYSLKVNNKGVDAITFTLNSGSVVLLYFDSVTFHVIGTQRVIKDIYFNADLPAEGDRHVNLILFDIE
jgi:hypothetical protein